MHKIASFLQNTIIIILLCSKNVSMFAQTDTAVYLSDAFLMSLSKDSLLSLEKETKVSSLNLTFKIHDVIIKKSKNSQNNTEIFDAYCLKAKLLWSINQHRNALLYFDSAQAVIKDVNPKLLNDVLIDKAVILQELHQYGEARSIYLDILKNQNNDILHRHISLCNLGVIFEEIDDFDNAIRYYKEALELIEQDKNNNYLCSYLTNLSEAYKQNNQANEALVYIQQAYGIAISDKDLELKNKVIIAYSHILADLGRFDEASDKIEIGTKYCEGEYAKRYFNNISIAKAEILLKQKKVNEAKQVLLESYNRLQNVANKTKIIYYLGEIHYNEKDIPKAKVFLIECQLLAEENNILEYAEKSHRLLFSIYDNEGNATKALYHLKTANNIRDTLLSFEKSVQISALQFKFDLEQSENKVKTTELKASRNLMILGTFAALIIFFAMYYIMKMRSINYHNLKAKKALIEEQKQQLEEKNIILELQKKKLEESNNLLQQFSYAVAHDLKEPMRTVSNFSSIIQKRYKSYLPEESSEYFDFVTSGAKRMTAMLDGLLQYAIVNTKVEEKEILDLDEAFSEVKQSLYKKIEDTDAEIILNVDMPKVNMSRIHCSQLFQNLISNALKFVDKKPCIEIDKKVVGNQVIVSIKDNGIGIDKDSGSKLFNLFHRVNKDDARFEGTGVGLALCKSIVEKYHGKIWFESEPNQGTTFFVQLPVVS